MPTVWEHTTDELAVLRLHGRNDATWDQKGLSAASDRFNYDYSDEELAGLTPAITEMARKVQTVQIVFNNMEDQGQRNALSMMRMLGLERRSA